ncbi:hypothetical protein [Pelagibacterium lentulum]|uniref:Uncharacterized protein n=1 Tax=Pelagibacterium lentulum TaxID=2029865 RepID=A0A916RPH9_9HYPH|nr:hypothetical protein [Pelagibacterium lentulum]GGA64919.1 hypothetical protein GCM10011499_39210 [Pelagibacterium lentulum]
MYGTIEDWRAYALARGDNAPTQASDTLATAALVRASDYIRFHYVEHFLPHCDASMPFVEEATYIAASLELATPGFFSTNIVPNEAIAEVAAGSARVKFRDGADPVAGAVPVVTMIDAMLAGCMPKDVQCIGIWAIGP